LCSNVETPKSSHANVVAEEDEVKQSKATADVKSPTSVLSKYVSAVPLMCR